MDENEKTALNEEIAKEQGIIKDAEAIIDADTAKLAAADAPQLAHEPSPVLAEVQAQIEQAATSVAAMTAPEALGLPAPTAEVVTADPAPAGDGVALALAEHPIDPGPAVGDELKLNEAALETVEIEVAPPAWQYSNPPPSMGRIVHYRAANAGESPDGYESHAAMITDVAKDWTVSLTVFAVGRLPFFVAGSQYSNVDKLADLSPGTWMWPERV